MSHKFLILVLKNIIAVFHILRFQDSIRLNYNYLNTIHLLDFFLNVQLNNTLIY